MKVLFATSGWPTHFFMMAPLAWAFRVRGHEVRVASPPSGTAPVIQAGLSAVTTGPDIDFMGIRQRALPHELPAHEKPESIEDLLEMLSRDGASEILDVWQEASFSAAPDLVAFAEAWRPDLVVADTMSVGGIVAAHAIGVPAVRHLLATDILGTVEGETLLEVLPGFREQFAKYGVTFTGDPAHYTLDPCPPSMQGPPAATRRQMRFVPYNGPATMPPWVLEPPARPRVCVTWGTSSAWSAGEAKFLIPDVVRALAEFDLDIVVTVGTGQQQFVGDLPPAVRLLENFPLHLLLPTTSLLIHQGGSSTILTGAHYGVPQLGIPFLAEQVDDAGAHAETGAGISLFADDADLSAITDAVRKLLHDPSYQDAAERLRQEMAEQPSLADTVRMLEEVCAGAATAPV